MVSLNCKTCKKEFLVKPCRKETAFFCSQFCCNSNNDRKQKQSNRIKENPIQNSDLHIFNKWHKQSDRARLKMSIAKKGKTPPNKKPDEFITCLVCNKIKKIKPAFKWKQKYCSKECSNIYRNKGKTSLAKKIRSSKEYKLWRESVFIRDKYTCIWCNTKWWKLNADHIKWFAQYPELRLAIDNWRTLCEDCHRTTDNFWNKARNLNGGV